jgi:putative transposase
MVRAAGATMFVERLWKSVKYEEIYLQAYYTFSQARQSLAKYFDSTLL